MDSIVTKSNLMKAGILGVAALLAANLTASKGKLWQGAAVVGAIAIAAPFAAKAA